MAEYRDDGLTLEEGTVMDHLLAAHTIYADLPESHRFDTEEFTSGIHRLQDLLAVRIARRHHPDGWGKRERG